jgi:hypothetical protein
VLGHPARSVGIVCRCGERLLAAPNGCENVTGVLSCKACGLVYDVQAGRVTELTPPSIIAAPAEEQAHFWIDPETAA